MGVMPKSQVGKGALAPCPTYVFPAGQFRTVMQEISECLKVRQTASA
jgi:hypothetical protein